VPCSVSGPVGVNGSLRGRLTDMDKQAVKRCARIAVSVFIGVLMVAILALWVRSCTHVDTAGFVSRSGNTLAVTSARGELKFSRISLAHLPPVRIDQVGFGTSSIYLPRFEHETMSIPYAVKWERTPHEFRLTVPTWFFAVFAAAIAWALWFGRVIPSCCSPRGKTLPGNPSNTLP
jgi:hypothetical protein